MKHNHSGESIDKSKLNKIYFAFVITALFGVVEYVTGQIFNSLALIADAAHMFTDSISLFIAAIGMYFISKAANKKYTYGVSKMDVTAAILNLILISFVVFDISSEAIQRIGKEVEIQSTGVISIAFIGLIVNIIVFLLLHNGYQSLNTKAAKIHVLGDLFGSIAAIFSGLMIYFFNLTVFDPIMSFIVCIVLINMAYNLLKEVLFVILDAVPEGLDINELEKDLLSVNNSLINIHDIHVWKCSNKEISLTAHIDVNTLEDWTCILFDINSLLKEKYNIEHVTLQPELINCRCC